MFRGNHPAKIDDKARLKVPGPFKKQLDEAQVTEVYITSMDGVRAQIWPLPEWEKQEEMLAEIGTMDDFVEKYINLTSFYGQQTEIDSQGRVTLPPILREKAKLDGEVVVLGKLQFLEVRNLKDMEEELPSISLSAEERQKVAAYTRRRRFTSSSPQGEPHAEAK